MIEGRLADRVFIGGLAAKDAAAVARLICQLTEHITDPSGLERRIASLAGEPRSKWVVAVLEGKVIGFGGMVWYSIPSKGRVAWLEEIVVDEPYRRHKVGDKIVKHLMLVARKLGIETIKLTAKPGIQRFYGRHGFRIKNERYMICYL